MYLNFNKFACKSNINEASKTGPSFSRRGEDLAKRTAICFHLKVAPQDIVLTWPIIPHSRAILYTHILYTSALIASKSNIHEASKPGPSFSRRGEDLGKRTSISFHLRVAPQDIDTYLPN